MLITSYKPWTKKGIIPVGRGRKRLFPWTKNDIIPVGRRRKELFPWTKKGYHICRSWTKTAIPVDQKGYYKCWSWTKTALPLRFFSSCKNLIWDVCWVRSHGMITFSLILFFNVKISLFFYFLTPLCHFSGLVVTCGWFQKWILSNKYCSTATRIKNMYYRKYCKSFENVCRVYSIVWKNADSCKVFERYTQFWTQRK